MSDAQFVLLALLTICALLFGVLSVPVRNPADERGTHWSE